MWQAIGIVATLAGVVALTLQGTRAYGWIVGALVNALWVSVFIAENQPAAVINAAITLTICTANYWRDPRRKEVQGV